MYRGAHEQGGGRARETTTPKECVDTHTHTHTHTHARTHTLALIQQRTHVNRRGCATARSKRSSGSGKKGQEKKKTGSAVAAAAAGCGASSGGERQRGCGRHVCTSRCRDGLPSGNLAEMGSFLRRKSAAWTTESMVAGMSTIGSAWKAEFPAAWLPQSLPRFPQRATEGLLRGSWGDSVGPPVCT
jgi:hypothetical protein